MKIIKVILVVVIFCSLTLQAQNKKAIEDIKYRRNSLATFLVTGGEFENKDKVLKAYENYEFPEKYNDHRIELSNADISNIEFSKDEFSAILEELGKTKEEYEKAIKLAKSIFGEDYQDPKLDFFKIKKWIKDNKIAKKLVEKWWDNDSNGELDMDLLTERGLFNASKEDIDKAKSEAMGTNTFVTGASLDLIPQTYIVLNKMKFVSNEVMASYVRATAEVAINDMTGMKKELATKAADKIYEKTKEGYSVKTDSYLFKLKWDEELQSVFYSKWSNKEEALSLDFQLEHVGTENANSMVTFSLKKEDKDRTEDDIIKLATVRNVEKVFSKLTKNYEDFKPKVPLAELSPLTAFIGTKEGLEGGETFEVLNEELDSKTGRTIYKSIGKIKVDKESIWDNSYSLDQEKKTEGPDRTTFKGKAKQATYGSLIRLIK